ncbi:MAG: universal stress protein [Planctomycetia bacterium]|nr:MAG: universal stress protein [Planctomycetia bacterium]
MNLKPRSVLWPTDFSAFSMHGGRYAKAFCDDFGATLHILHVVPPPLNPDVALLVPSEAPISMSDPAMLDDCRASLDRLIKDHFGGSSAIRREALFGNPWSAVCEYARQQQIDLIVVSTHGRTGIAHVLIGSTAERIVQHAPCPVLTVKGGGRGFL